MAVAAPVAGVDKKKGVLCAGPKATTCKGRKGGTAALVLKGPDDREKREGSDLGGGERGAAWSRGRRGEKRGRRSGGRPAVARERWACPWAGPRRKGSRPGRKKRSGPSPE
jgi:hypothetical protein